MDIDTCKKGHTEKASPIYIDSGGILIPVDRQVFVCDETK